MFSGTIISFNDIHGNGVLESDSDGEQYKFSYKSLIKQGYKIAYEGQKVTFETEQTAKGPIAVKIASFEDSI